MFSHSTKLATAAALLQGVSAGFEASGINNIATYWGQNSAGVTGGGSQESLATYCQNSNIDIIPMSFLVSTNPPQINLANIGDSCEKFDDGNLHCPQVAEDIKTCQSLGKQIILSIGGATYTEGGFASEAEATQAAQNVWAMFGPGGNSTGINRPFDDASVDGFDFDFESVTQNMVPFGKTLRSLMDAAGDNYLLTAAPQCPFPDAADDEMLDGQVSFDIVWVQFYNNFCGLNGYPGQFNFDTWDEWASTKSANPDVKVMIGAPASPSAASTGYVDPSTLATIIDSVKDKASFGGVMLWDVSQAYANDGIIDSIATALGGSSKRSMRRGSRLVAANAA
jgi:chitinase